VTVPGTVRVEASRKTLKSRDGGVVRQINVREGDEVKAGQLLLKLDDTVARAQVEILENQYYALLMQAARLRAEVERRDLVVPAELVARRSDPKILLAIQNEQTVFEMRRAAIDSQAAILDQRLEQLTSARAGLQVQADSIAQQGRLLQQETQGYEVLEAKGLAPRPLILRMQRQLADTEGRRGALAADINRNGQQAGETRMQLASLYEQRTAESASALRDAEGKLADVGSRLAAAREGLAQTEVRAPADGYVLGLTQNTVGGVAGSGEVLMDVVPNHAPLVITVQIRPSDIDEVRPGMSAQVMLQAYSSYKVPKIGAEVMTVSADVLHDAQEKTSFYRADLKIPPAELQKLPKGVRLYPGMPATAMIRTNKRTILSFLVGPIGDIIDRSLREE
jgi:HlyD family type I secretion membrane fusion protein